MSIARLSFALLCASFVHQTQAADWLMFGGNPQRTSWIANDPRITPETVKNLKLEWSTKLENQSKEMNALTVPVVAINLGTPRGFRDIAIVAGAADTVFGIDADTGKVMWSRKMTAEGTPRNPNSHWLCPNSLNATPVIDRATRTVYVLASDGKVHSLNVINGEDQHPPVQFTPPYGKPWSLTIVDGTLYTTTSQNCNAVRSAVYAMDLKDPKRPVSHFIANPIGGAGMWGRAGAAITSAGRVIAETGDGPYDVNQGRYSDTFLSLEPKTVKLADYYTPANRTWITKKDLDMGNMSPVVFKYKNWELVSGAGKEGVIYLLDATKLGGDDHRTPLFRSPLYSNEDADFASRGYWGALSAGTDHKGVTWLFAPCWGDQGSKSPKFAASHGDTPNGSIMAFKLDEQDGKPVLVPAWRSRDLNVPEPPVYVNGVVFALSSGENTRQVDGGGRLYSSKERIEKPAGHAILYAFDAETGKELFNSAKTIPTFTHLSGIAVSEGRVYVVGFDNTVYAFGLGQEQ